MVANSTNSGKIHALFYSLVLSCVLNQLNPRVYLHYLLTQVHALRKEEVDSVSLLPDRTDREKLNIFIEEPSHPRQAILQYHIDIMISK